MALRPADRVALALHQLQELLPGDGVLHGLIDLHGEPHLPALSSGGNFVLRLGGTGDRLLTLWLTDGQAVMDAERVRDLAELRQVRLSKWSFLPLWKLTELTMKWEWMCARSVWVATTTS